MTSDESTTPAADAAPLLYAEDIVVGEQFELGEYLITADEITEFGAHWDPLPLHLSESHADGTAFGRLVASGLHTMAVFQRLTVLAVFGRWSIFAGRRLDDVRLLAPVFPGVTLTGGLLVRSVEHNHPGRSLVTCVGWISDGEKNVLELVTESYVNRRPA